MISRVFYTILFCISSIICFAQNVTFKAIVSSQKVTVDNPFQLSFSVDNTSGIQNFNPPSLDAFYVLSGPNRSSSFSNINGSTSSSISFSYILQAKRTGKFTIGCATAVVDKKGVSSNTNTIEVVNNASTQKRYYNKAPQNMDENQDPYLTGPKAPKQPSAKSKIKTPSRNAENTIGNKIFAQLDVDKKTAYVGEQILASYNIYAQIPCQIDVKKINTPEGFWTQDFTDVLNPQESEKVIINGQPYRKFTLRKTALFASKAGKLHIPPMEFEGFAQIENQNAAGARGGIIEEILGDVFENSFVNNIPLNLKTDSVTITAKETPVENKPINYTDNIGDYTLESSIDKTELSTNDAVKIVITIRGKGNIKLINAPSTNWGADFEALDPIIFDTITNNKNDVEGYKVFKYTLQPKHDGNLTVPSVAFSYFDPETKTYKTLQSPEYTLKVTESKSTADKKLNAGAPKELHDILNEDNMEKLIPNVLVEKPIYWLGFILPLLTLLAFIWRNKKAKQKEITGEHKTLQNKHNNMALEKLSIAHQMLQNNNKNGFWTQIDQALWNYLSDKLNIPLSQLNNQVAKQYMQQHHIDPATQDKFVSITQQCQDAMYGLNATADMQQVYTQSIEIINKIENSLSA